MPQQTKWAGNTRQQEYKIILDVFAELDKVREPTRYPGWPVDLVHATSVMVEEAAEALQSANEVVWGHKQTTLADFRKEVVQTIAMCLRLLVETPGVYAATGEEEPQALQG